ncbi:hypothetical protein FB563_7228 [Streptomyces puniciscabiei]|uniref:Cytochrome P450 n=1 Tax=Streptomyces puniciscabiei TaxID=164348 RepID=A0A542SZM1_9ACTN|nr:hypothetical protein FB563_7228 [Streptomyces puniciscabiei]
MSQTGEPAGIVVPATSMSARAVVNGMNWTGDSYRSTSSMSGTARWDPDRFDPDRRDNEHLGMYNRIHYCFGAPLARIELHAAIPELFRRVKFSGLLEDPPPYRANAVLRGPRHLPMAIEGFTA